MSRAFRLVGPGFAAAIACLAITSAPLAAAPLGFVPHEVAPTKAIQPIHAKIIPAAAEQKSPAPVVYGPGANLPVASNNDGRH